MITLGQLRYSNAEALQGFSSNRNFSAYDGNENFGAWRLTMTASNGALSNVSEVGVTPADVPEPASMALFGIGLLGFVAFRRKSGNALVRRD